MTLRAVIFQANGSPVSARVGSFQALQEGGDTGDPTGSGGLTSTSRNGRCCEENTAGGCERSRLLWPRERLHEENPPELRPL